ncbi:MAG: glycoside hydrolase family 3 N-terminal domain-containing protein, partial [Allosphingosinicella sp.]
MIDDSRVRSLFATRLKRALGALTVGAVVCTGATVLPASASATSRAATISAADVEFQTQADGTYAGMPVFDGNVDHLDAYVETLLNYLDYEGVVRWAQGMRGDYTIRSGPNAGNVVPGMLVWREGTQGISTDFPTALAMGQTWNRELTGEIGSVIGDEGLYEQDYSESISSASVLINSALQDIRSNPLTGRLDEGIGEDPVLASELLSPMAEGISGIEAEDNSDGFWTKATLNTKHYTGYLAQWFREPGNSDIPQRAMMEYYSQPIEDAIESGAVGGMLTSYGRWNGIPNSVSPMIKRAQEASPWGEHGNLYTVPDNNADRHLALENSFSNGFDDRYTPSLDTATALMMIADEGSIAVNTRGSESPLTGALIDNVESGMYGVTREAVYAVASSQVIPLIRMGLFNERDENGLPKHYPFLDESALSGTPIDYTVAEHQDTAMRAAEEGLVLLKNDKNVLPLDSDDEIVVSGPLADARFKSVNAASTPELENAGLTPIQAIREQFGDDTVFESDGEVVALKSVATGKYLAHGEGASPAVEANADAVSGATTFESFAWGQDAYGLLSTTNDQWLQVSNNSVNVGGTQSFGTDNT